MIAVSLRHRRIALARRRIRNRISWQYGSMHLQEVVLHLVFQSQVLQWLISGSRRTRTVELVHQSLSLARGLATQKAILRMTRCLASRFRCNLIFGTSLDTEEVQVQLKAVLRMTRCLLASRWSRCNRFFGTNLDTEVHNSTI